MPTRRLLAVRAEAAEPAEGSGVCRFLSEVCRVCPPAAPVRGGFFTSWHGNPHVKAPLRSVALLSFLTLVTACGDSTPAEVTDGVTIADLVGSWTASSHTFTNNANSTESFDIVANGGETRTTVLSHGGARTWFDFGTVSDEWDAQLAVSGNTITSTPVETTRETRVWTFTLEGTVLTLTDETSSFDFTLSAGAEVSATEVVVFVKQ